MYAPENISENKNLNSRTLHTPKTRQFREPDLVWVLETSRVLEF